MLSLYYVQNLFFHQCVSSDGTTLELSETAYVWISDVFSGPGIPRASLAGLVEPSLSTTSLPPLLEVLKKHLAHNYYPAMLFMGAGILSLHYQEFIERLRYCPIPLACGESGTGKTTILEAALSLMGARETRVYSKATREKIFDMCCECAGIPLGVDDPHSKADINKLLVDLYNGKKGATVGKGERQPSSTIMITANFSPADQERLAYCVVVAAMSNYPGHN